MRCELGGFWFEGLRLGFVASPCEAKIAMQFFDISQTIALTLAIIPRPITNLT